VKIVGEVEKNFRGGAARLRFQPLWCSGLAHNPHGKLGLIVEQANINEVRYACSVHMYQCINEL
jgi:hypothetical protein